MNDLQKAGGLSALIQAAAYLVGIGLAATMLAPYLSAGPAEYAAFLVDNQALMYAWHWLLYIVTGVFLVPLVLALYHRLRQDAPALMQVAAAFGLIWAGTVIAAGMIILTDLRVLADLYARDAELALMLWPALNAIETGLGGGIELPGGLWLLLVSWAALRSAGLPRALSYLGLLTGAAGILTLIPPLSELAIVFGLGAVIWFAGVGLTLLLRGPADAAATVASVAPAIAPADAAETLPAA